MNGHGVLSNAQCDYYVTLLASSNAQVHATIITLIY